MTTVPAKSATSTAYGYDRARQSPVSREHTRERPRTSSTPMDGMKRLVTFDRGDLDLEKSSITGTPVCEEDWSLDMTGNWFHFVQKTSGTTGLDQARTHNGANETTAIAAMAGTNWADPVHDRAGNMTTIPKPSDLAHSLTAKYDAWNRLVEVEDGAIVVGEYRLRWPQSLRPAATSTPALRRVLPAWIPTFIASTTTHGRLSKPASPTAPRRSPRALSP